ncbi:MAG TPA: hypothetical protein VJI13_02875 [Candidatus Norongarragalinales archaeon]|nr:hypothetical protein [Candidatus Norongarragalinales archaeon]
MKELKILGYVSLIYGGFLIITYLALAYSAIWRNEFLPIFPENPRIQAAINASSAFYPPGNGSSPPGDFERFRQIRDPYSLVFSPQSLGILLTGILLLANGYFLQRHLRQKENKETKKFMLSTLLSDEEKLLFDELVKAGGQMTQKQLAMRGGFSAVKTFRIIRRMEQKKLLKSFEFGMTKKIVLNED